ncbi:hypothetical protein [Leadbetterella sp. DM7]|uniref:hypothetical protein n=1 Tax=Leadbetterella sp. DM7 TaxID=3235085 RepID=UPI00349E6F60
MKKIRCSILILLLIGGIYFFGFMADGIDKKMNTVSNPHPLENLQQKVEPVPFMADLHCDALLWDRNLLEEADHGHVDLPRMQKAGMALQFFSIVSKTPKGINIERNPANRGSVTITGTSLTGTWKSSAAGTGWWASACGKRRYAVKTPGPRRRTSNTWQTG